MRGSFGLDTGLPGRYHIETFAELRQNRIINQVYREGRIIHVEEHPYDPELTERKVIDLIQTIHNRKIEELSGVLKLAEDLRQKPAAEAYTKVGIILRKHGFLEDAREFLTRSIDLDPNRSLPFLFLAKIEAQYRNYEEALSHIDRAIEIDPEHPDLHFTKAEILSKMAKYQEAIGPLREALRLNPEYAEAHFRYGIVLLKAFLIQGKDGGHQSECLTHLKHAQILDERFQIYEFREAIAAIEREDFSKAVEFFATFEQRFESIDVHELVTEFELFSRYGDSGSLLTIDEHIERLTNELESHPKYADLHNALGKAYLVKMRALFNAAIGEFKQALAINEDYEEAKRNLKLVENEGKGFVLLLRAILK
ncbi:hypothetical protein DRP53_02175 [candidate division WOR-3 bacterium]|uniref:Tetratricopeptide repeat protein n=1 Tax=candidate division WOR-3 bacterium TaxID=2052148 RepID=A0A660SMA3_UNCW3|nr:MAG: hypothetical protein DRP53_02175 [candidate division WOR-3 bacterium]